MTPLGVHWRDQPGGQPGVTALRPGAGDEHGGCPLPRRRGLSVLTRLATAARAAAGKTLRLRRRQASTGPSRLTARRWPVRVVSGVLVAALAVAGVAGAARYVQTFWLYRGFPAPVAPRSVVAGGQGAARRVPVILPAVQAITVTSAALGGWPDPVLVVLPPGYASHPRLRYPVLYLLHGVPGLPDQFLNVGQAATAEAALVAEGRMKPVILVMPAGSRSFLADQEWADGIRPGSGWETFVARDLVAAIDARYRTIAAAGGRGIAGLSEGGYGALNIGLHHPGEFGVLESWSGYMAADPIPAIFGRSPAVRAYNSPLTWAPRAAPLLRASRAYIWFYSGAADLLSRQNRAFAAELSALGVAHRFFETAGGHNWALWRQLMPLALITASEHLSHG